MFQCPLCNQFSATQVICHQCWPLITKLFKQARYCRHCGQRILNGLICVSCSFSPTAIDYFWASCYYRPPLTQLLQRWKFQSKLQYSTILSKIMLANPPHWIKSSQLENILAMPTTTSSYASRLFNPSLELTRGILKHYSIRLISTNLITKCNLLPQHQLSQKARMSNLQGAFKLHATLNSPSILIIDDVATTLATLNELAKLLQQTQVTTVYAWVLAQSENS
ncbi:MAG: hypothetical protein WDW19_04600 [Neisseriaceae bacterium]